jgi:hypothetical protein
VDDGAVGQVGRQPSVRQRSRSGTVHGSGRCGVGMHVARWHFLMRDTAWSAWKSWTRSGSLGVRTVGSWDAGGGHGRLRQRVDPATWAHALVQFG